MKGDHEFVVKDAKGYWSKRNEKARSPGWFILVISHMAVLVVGISFGHWIGGRFANWQADKGRWMSLFLESGLDKLKCLGFTVIQAI